MIKKLIREKLLLPFHNFMHDSRSAGITLICCTVVSIVLANGSTSGAYLGLWNNHFSASNPHHWTLGPLQLPNSFQHWINDAGMTVFFLLAGMEIKKELLNGELSTFKKAILPAGAALGGMLFPAAIFLFINHSTDYASGWGIPMATDIAFSLGIASLLGKRVPISLRIFLTALAIIDDLGAIITIAAFYSNTLNLAWLLSGLGIFGLLLIGLFRKMRFGWWNILLGIGCWYCIFNSGIHATVAGVLFAFTVPLEKIDTFLHRLHLPIYFIVLPLFALANTAIAFPPQPLQALTGSLGLGIIAGLVVGKMLGIFLASALLVRLRIASLPSGVKWTQVIGIGFLAGIGFTMSIFMAMLAFDNPMWQDMAKIAVLAGSLLSGTAAIGWFSTVNKKKRTMPQPITVPGA